jgi:hypothetical protein
MNPPVDTMGRRRSPAPAWCTRRAGGCSGSTIPGRRRAACRRHGRPRDTPLPSTIVVACRSDRFGSRSWLRDRRRAVVLQAALGHYHLVMRSCRGPGAAWCVIVVALGLAVRLGRATIPVLMTCGFLPGVGVRCRPGRGGRGGCWLVISPARAAVRSTQRFMPGNCRLGVDRRLRALVSHRRTSPRVTRTTRAWASPAIFTMTASC